MKKNLSLVTLTKKQLKEVKAGVEGTPCVNSVDIGCACYNAGICIWDIINPQ